MNRQIPGSAPVPADSKASVIALMDQKSRIETQIQHHMSILRSNESTMDSPLLDTEGFPRADIDIVSVRNVNATEPAGDTICSEHACLAIGSRSGDRTPQ